MAARSRKTWSRKGAKTHRAPPRINHTKHLRKHDSSTVFHRPGEPAPGHRHNAKEHRIYAIFRSKGYSKSHAWAATEGFAPRSIRAKGVFKTSPRTYSETQLRAREARRGLRPDRHGAP